ncbi:TetR/AcrR family transcriptional regulator [Saccharomonospora azurea]|uniref:Transcriptional regulator n=1 Tax=Saccharomonospora azurea NA-128 TaxID=882081 RepID=H8GF41_9PSEU|nr:TetR/AcrR family transcriptional regulator [Saccharomonospora azurea]EHY87985.1 transcriptional regulator [Saccharomonospora azurea NA-128]
MESELGLRERKKIATKTALYEAAMRLSVENGYDTVTVEAIADAVGVSRRTFSNYFASKEEAMLYGDSVRLHALLDAVAARPAEESAWTALRGAVRSVLRDLQRQRRERDDNLDWLTCARVIRSHPALLSEQVATYASFERALATTVDARLSPDDRSVMRARVIAACFLAALRAGTQAWLDHDSGTPASQFIDQALVEAGLPFP